MSTVYKTVGEAPDKGAKHRKVMKSHKSKLDKLSTYTQEPDTEPEIIHTMHSKKYIRSDIDMITPETRAKERIEKYENIRELFQSLQKATTQERRDSIKREIRKVAGDSKINFPEHLQSPDDFRACKEALLKKIKSKNKI